MIGDLIKGEIWTETRARGEHRVKMKAEIHQGDASKKHQRLPTKPQKLGTGGGGGSWDRCSFAASEGINLPSP